MKLSDFLKMNKREMENYVKECLKERYIIDGVQCVNLHLTGFCPAKSIKVLKKAHSHRISYSHVYFCGTSLHSKITFFVGTNYKKVDIIFMSRSKKIIRMCYGECGKEGNNLKNVPMEGSFWDPKKKRWRWED